jgi:TonB family protein
MNWLYYLAEANLYLVVFYLAYCLFLTRETYYQLNRAYLVAACIISFILPVLQLGVLKPAEVLETTAMSYAAPVETAPQLPVTSTVVPVVTEQHLGVNDYLIYAYLLGACVVFCMLMVKLFSLLKLVRNAERVEHDKYKLVRLPQTDIAFSFFNYLFIGNNAPGANTIIRHELVHMRQKHSVDIIFIELLKIINWFNPFIYLLQNSLKTIHEYIADEQTAAHETDALTYSSFLVNNAYGTGGSSITHSFFNYNLLKKRIIMLNQERSGNLARLKYLIAAPICAGLLCASTLAFSKDYGWVDLAPAKSINLDDFKIPNLAHVDKNGGITLNIRKNNSVAGFNDLTKNNTPPLLIANGKRYKLDEVKKGFSVIINADSTTQYNAGNTYAVDTWGKDAVNGVLVLHGESASVKIEKGNLPETVHFNFPHAQTSKFPPPSVFKPGFGRLMGHLQHNVDYAAVGDEKNSFVGVSFNVGTDRKISDINIFKSAGNGYDAIAKSAFESFDGVVTAKPGKHTFMLNYFSEKGYTNEKVLDGNKYDVNLVIVRPKPGEVRVTFPPPIAPKEKRPSLKNKDKNGAYVSEGRLNNGPVPIQTIAPKGTKALFIVDGKKYEFTPESLAKYNAKSLLYMSCDKMVVYEQGNAYAEKNWGKYGKVAVLTGNAAIRIVENPFGDTKETAAVDTIKKAQPLANFNGVTLDDVKQFSKYLANNIRYPFEDRQDAIGGRVITVFSVDADGNLQYAKVVRTPSGLMGDEVLRVLKKWPRFSWFKPGIQYTVPVTFNVQVEGPVDGEIKSRVIKPNIYNPNSVEIPDNATASLMLSDIVIRGYVKKS